MMTILLSMNISMSLIFIMMNHPLSMGSMLLIQTITISLITGNFNNNFWFSYILFLILVGGMLILFMYMTSVASNEKFKFNPKLFMTFIPIIPLSIMMHENTKTHITNNEMILFNENVNLMNSLNKFINIPLTTLLIFMMMYLFLALIATAKITDFKKGSMRQMN